MHGVDARLPARKSLPATVEAACPQAVSGRHCLSAAPEEPVCSARVARNRIFSEANSAMLRSKSTTRRCRSTESVPLFSLALHSEAKRLALETWWAKLAANAPLAKPTLPGASSSSALCARHLAICASASATIWAILPFVRDADDPLAGCPAPPVPASISQLTGARVFSSSSAKAVCSFFPNCAHNAAATALCTSGRVSVQRLSAKVGVKRCLFEADGPHATLPFPMVNLSLRGEPVRGGVPAPAP